MKTYLKSYQSLSSDFYLEEDLELIGSILNGMSRVFIIEKEFMILIENPDEQFAVCEFENKEVLETDFRMFALPYCKGHFETFKSIQAKEKESKKETEKTIAKFLDTACYGESMEFKDNLGNKFLITFIRGGFIYSNITLKTSVFSPM
jgi:hypothetical protein